MTNRKDLPSPSSPNFLARVREELHALLGKTGSDRDRALTLRDALETGVLVPGPGGSLVPGVGTGGGGTVEPYEPDLTPPPQPGAFTATPAISHILISQAAPFYTQGRGHGRTRVYGAQWVSGPLPVFADAVEVGRFAGTVWGMPSNPATTWHLWIKWESQDGAPSATPSGGTNGVAVTTGQDVALLLDALAGQISASELASSLATPIGQIPGLVSGLAQEAIDRAQGDAAEAAARAAALAQEAADRAAAISSSASAQAASLAAEVDNRVAAISAVDSAIRADLATADAAVVSSLTSAFTDADAATLASANSYTFSKSEINTAISAMGTQLTTNFTAADAATLATAQNFTYSRSAIDAADAATLSTLRSEFAAADTTTLASAQDFTYSRATIDSAISSSASTLRAQITGGSTATDLNLLTSGLLYQMRETSAAQDAALSQQITLLSAGAGEQFDCSNIWYFDSSVEGWTANITTSTTVSAVSGWLRMAASTGTQSGRMFQSPAALGIDGAKYPQVRLRVRKVGSPTWVGRLYFITTANSTWDTTKSVVVTEPTYNANGIGLLTFNMPAGWMGATIAQVRFEASTSITTSAYFELDWVAVGRPSPGASSAQLQALQSAMMAGDDANAQNIITLNAALTGKADASALNALETRVTSAEGVNTSQGSSITSLQNSVTTINNTLTNKADASALNSLTTRVTTAENNITSQGGSITTLNNSLTTTNTNVTAAQTAANNAATLAGSKGKVIVQSAAPDVADRLAQNLWIDTTGGANTPKRWNGSAWVAVTDKVATDAAAAAAAAQATANTKADASALNALTTRVTTAENTITSQGSSITSLNNALTTTNNTVATKADASALSALDTRVTSAEGVNTSQGTAITSLQNSVTTLNNTVATKADTSALTALSNTVTTQGNTLTATANQANVLQARLSNIRDIFSETWDGSDPLSRWQSYDGAGEQVIVSVTDGVGGKALQVGNNAGNDMRWLVHRDLIPFDPNKLYRLRVRVRRTAGTGTFYLGWAGVAADGVTLVNSTGGNSYSGQHYHAVVGSSPGTAWTEYTGYTKGHGASAGTSGNGLLASPSKMHPNVRYLRLLVLVNYNGAAGITEVGQITVDDAEVKEIESGLNTAIATKASQTALNDLSTRVDATEDGILIQGGQITALQGDLELVENGLATKADASAVNAIATRIESTTGGIVTSSGSTVVGLQNSISTADGKAVAAQATANAANTLAGTKADASALTTTNTNVSNLAETVSAQAGQITTIQSRVNRVVNYLIRSAGSSSQSSSYPGVFSEAGAALTAAVRSYVLVVFNGATGAMESAVHYDVFGNGEVAEGRNAAALAAALNALGSDKVVAVYTWDEPRNNRLTSGLDAAMYRCGASRSIFGAPDSAFRYRSAYILVGVPGVGEGAGIERYAGATDSDPLAYCEYSLQLVNGRPVGMGGNPLNAAVQTEITTRATQTGELFAKYTVKIDTNGYVSGFGLASTANNATPFSEFIVRADSFAIASPSGPGIAPAEPFIVRTTPTTIGGVSVPVGVYMQDAFIQNGTITNAKIANLAVDDAKIASLSVSKLTAGSIAVGQHAQSTGYVAGSSGWRINGNGTAEFSGVVVRGTIFASQGAIGGWTIGSNYLQSTTYVLGTSGTRFNSDGTGQIGGVTIYSQGLGAGSTAYDTGAGAWIGRDGRFSLRNAGGTQYLRWDGTALQISGALQAATGTFAGSLSAATGTFSGALSAATGTFSGSLTADAVNAVNTINLAGQAVTIPVSAYTSGSVSGNSTAQTAPTFVSTGAPVLILFSAQSTIVDSGGAGDGVLNLDIRRNGSTIITRTLQAGKQFYTVMVVDSPPPGSTTYTAVCAPSTATHSTSRRALFCLETKR